MASRNRPSRSTTDDALLAMLREDTGRSLLDSGGIDGRNFQRNQARDLEAEEPAVVSFRWGEINVALRVYHWLRDRLALDEDGTDAFDGAFREECDADDSKSWGELREAFPAWFARRPSLEATATDCAACGDHDDACEECGGVGTAGGDGEFYVATGLYGDGEPCTVNVYNEENLLDQVILFTYFELRFGDGRRDLIEAYVALQIHGGCDVRGGYSRPRIFRLADHEELAIFDFRRGTIFCDANPDHWWMTDDGYHWYREGACGRGAGTQLEAYDRVQVIDDEVGNDDGADRWIEGALCWNERGEGFCPECGARLRASAR